jgi:hypothetical protein
MRPTSRALRRATVLALALGLPGQAAAQRVTLGARVGGAAVRLDVDAPTAAAPSIRDGIDWSPVRPGMSWAELELSAGALGIPVRAILVQIDPQRFDFRLELATAANRMTGVWALDSVPADAALALNAGQFRETGPWGWVVLGGVERRDPGHGPLSVGLAVTDSGALRWVPSAELRAARADRTIRYAFQSFPVLRYDGRVPALALDPALVDQNHRDARLILGERDDGSLLIVLTRFDVLGAAGERVPIGLTLPESVVLMGSLETRHAVMLDGGVSAQLLLRGPATGTLLWKGARRVPLALIATPRRD